MALSTISGTTGITDATITSAKLADFTAAVDLNGVELILDADQDTTITADTDDRIDFKIAGVEHFSFSNSSGDSIIKPMVDTKDIIFQQYDGNKVFEINDGNYVGVGGNATAAGQIRIYEDTDNGSHYSGFTVGNLTESYTLALPNADGSSGQALTTNGSGVLSFTTLSANTPSSADGQALGSASLEWSDLFLADSSTIQFGNDQDTILTHTDGAGLTLNSTNKLMFNDASQFIHAPSATVLDIGATDEIELTATLIDVVGNLAVSGTLAQADALTMATNKKIIFRDAAIHISSTADGDLAIAADDEIDITSTLIDVNGNLDVSGTVNSGAITSSGTITGFNLDLADDANIRFGNDDEIRLIHVADTGLILKHTATADDKPISLTLQTGETDIAANDVLGVLNFQAPDEATGTDAILVDAGIADVSEGDIGS